MNTPDSPAPESTVATILQQFFEAYYDEFLDITLRAKARFENREWRGVMRDAEERIDLYHHHLNLVEERIRRLLGAHVHDYSHWSRLRDLYWQPYAGQYRSDLALIFFYSVMRRLYVETGNSIEYSDDEIRRSSQSPGEPGGAVRRYPVHSLSDVNGALIQQIVDDFELDAPFRNLAEDTLLAAEMIRPELRSMLGLRDLDWVEVLRSAFFRNKTAYLMGRVVSGEMMVPFVFVLLHPDEGIIIDSVLTHEADLSHVFTSARSNFHTDPTSYREVFEFLESIGPTRPKAYIYSSIGFLHPAKLQLVKELRHHLATSGERFHTAKGVPGTVMAVFTLPTFRYVFKVIRDVSTKETFRGRQHVVGQYWRVHRMDRVGRMLDIMTFHNLRFDRSLFEEPLLEELVRAAPSSVHEEDGHLVFRYMYAQRQISPLDVYLADPSVRASAKAHAVIEYGHAIKDLAAAGIFVGDYMPKNFGVNRLGRVILYDYDDLDELVNWTFRELPDPPEWAETLPYDEWLSKGELDVFPEHDFRIFTVPENERRIFLEHHADVLHPRFWNEMKQELLSGKVPDFVEYPEEKRLRPDPAGDQSSRPVRSSSAE